MGRPKHKIIEAVEAAIDPKARRPKAKVPSTPTGRYIYCPASTVMHEPRLIPVVQGQARCFFRCSCGTNGFMSQFWQGDRHGYSFEQAQQIAAERGVIVCGL